MYLGRWDDAVEHATDTLQQASSQRNISRVMALTALGRVQCRRGDAAAAATLDEALELAVCQRTPCSGSVPCERRVPRPHGGAETLRAVVDEAGSALKLAIDHRHPWFAGELAYWLGRAGVLSEAPVTCAAPFALQL